MSARNQWYYANPRNEHQGPLDAGTLLGKLDRGELNAKTLVWCEGMAEWQPIADVEVQLRASVRADNGTGDTPPDVHAAPAQGDTGSAETASPYTAPSSTLSVNAGTVVAQRGDIVLAGFWRRVAANVIDGLIINTVSSIVLLILAPIFGIGLLGIFGLPGDGVGHPEALGAGFMLFQVVFQLLALILTGTYYVWLHSSLNMATLGKMAVGIKVVRPDGERISVARAIGRYFAFILSSMTLGIGFIMAGLTQRKQALHDMICDTLVVDKWAFTDRPDLQQKGLGAVTIVVLVLFGVFFVCVLLVVAAMIAAAVAQFGG